MKTKLAISNVVEAQQGSCQPEPAGECQGLLNVSKVKVIHRRYASRNSLWISQVDFDLSQVGNLGFAQRAVVLRHHQRPEGRQSAPQESERQSSVYVNGNLENKQLSWVYPAGLCMTFAYVIYIHIPSYTYIYLLYILWIKKWSHEWNI